MPLVSKIGKSTLSMYLRTNCDRELYFSLFKSNSHLLLEAEGIPTPLSARPNIQLVTQAGQEFEEHEYNMLVNMFGATVVKHRLQSGKFVDLDVKRILPVTPVPGFCLQPAIDPELFRAELLCDNIGLTPAQAARIPKIQGMRPDIILVRPRGEMIWEVAPTGKRRRLATSDSRTALSVVDVKNTAEGNKSYAAEVVLYSVVLANWLEKEGLDNRFFVSEECFLWTHNEKPALDALLRNYAGATVEEKFQVVLSTLERVEFAVVAPSVLKFFIQDIPRVLDLADASGWPSIDYHVCGLCSNCDWLGYERWLSTDDKAKLAAHPTWYCKPAAKDTDHLSQLPHLSKGARQVLEGGGTTNLSDLVLLPSTAGVLKTHSFLKREKLHIAPRAQAIGTNTVAVDGAAALSGLARWVDFQVSIVVNFDAAAGRLTGIALRHLLFVRDNGGWRPIAGEFEATIDNNTQQDEWNALFTFLDTLQNAFANAIRQRGLAGESPAEPRTQIYFWEQRQFEELCAAVGRHLPAIINQPRGSLLPALAWLFPPDELLRRQSAVSPHVVFVGDIAKRVVYTTAPHAFTLWSTYQDYNLGGYMPRLENYFWDPFSNGIPRERIFEVWKNQGTIRRGGILKTKTQASNDYSDAMKSQAQALSDITRRLRTDFSARLQGNANRLDVGRPRGATGVAFDSKVWIEWAKISAKTVKMEREAEFSLPADALESSYKALVLTDLIEHTAAGTYVYQVSPESRECKLDDTGAYFVLGDANRAGLPLETPKSLGIPEPPAEDSEWQVYKLSLAQIFRVRLIRFDRENLEAELELLPRNPSSSEQQSILRKLVRSGRLPLRGNLFLMEGLPYSNAPEVEEVLKAVGNPPIALPDPSAVVAMGGSTHGQAAGTSPLTPLSYILWQANSLSNATFRTAGQAAALAGRATYFSGHRNPDYSLDISQQRAIASVAQQRLSLIWGPPGTGKSSTLVAYLLAVVEESLNSGVAKKILVTGPNYRAVEVLADKLLKELNSLSALAAELYVVYSRSREPRPLQHAPAAHLKADSMSLGHPLTDTELISAYAGPGVTIFATSAHNARKLAGTLTLNSTAGLLPAFDLVILDESSQIPLTLGVIPLATLKPDAEVIIAGDLKQMPPIQDLAPPDGAEHLVGSIHEYLKVRFNLAEQYLLVNYRSCEQLVDYARTLGYPPTLEANEPDLQLQFLSPLSTVALPPTLLVSEMRMALEAVLDPSRATTALLYNDTQSSQANQTEAHMVAALAYMLRSVAAKQLAPQPAGTTLSFFNDEEFFSLGIGIVTPHKAQRALVLAQLRALFPTVTYKTLQEAVDTVERFQGGERHTIIVSYGVGDVDVIQGEEEFLLQMQRTNVAVSRAMAKCILLMPNTLAYHLPADSKVSQSAGALKSYLEEFCSSRQDFRLSDGSIIDVRWR